MFSRSPSPTVGVKQFVRIASINNPAGAHQGGNRETPLGYFASVSTELSPIGQTVVGMTDAPTPKSLYRHFPVYKMIVFYV